MLENIEFRKGILFLRLSSKITDNNSQVLNTYIDEVINNYGIRYISINLINIDDNNKILNILKDINNKVISNGGLLYLCEASNNLLNIMKKNKLFVNTYRDTELKILDEVII